MSQHPDHDPFDDELSRRLSGLAHHATSYADGDSQLPASTVRRLGSLRRHRRIGGVVATALAGVVLVGGGALGVSRMTSDQPTPATTPTAAVPSTPVASSSAPTPSPSTTPSSVRSAASLDPALLPTTAELAWRAFGDFATTGTSQGQGQLPKQPCVRSMTGLGAQAIGRRDFATPAPATVRATAWVLQLDTAAAATQAAATLQSWGAACAPDRPHTVTVGPGRAEFYEAVIPGSGGYGTFVDYGIVTVGNRVGVVLMTYVSTEAHWSYSADDNSGLPLHPMIRSLPLVAARLAGTPGSTPSSPAPTACRGGQSGLQVSVSVVEGSAGMGHLSYRITVGNTTQATCTIHGFPGVQFADDAGGKIGADATRTGPTGPTITLKPGQSTTAIVRLSNAGNYDSTCQGTTSNGFRVFLPGSTEPSHTYSPDMQACANPAITQLTVTAFGNE